MKLSFDEILQYQQNRQPYLMLDYVDEVIPGKSATGFKKLDKEWFFDVHWEGDPNMPGMLQIEGLMQLSALIVLTLPGNKGKKMYLSSADKLIFKKKIIPGDKYIMKSDLVDLRRGVAKFIAAGFVNDEKVNSATFTLILPDILGKFVK